jgi:hypothetical protein
MSYGIIHFFAGGTKEQYDAVLRVVCKRFTPGSLNSQRDSSFMPPARQKVAGR